MKWTVLDFCILASLPLVAVAFSATKSSSSTSTSAPPHQQEVTSISWQDELLKASQPLIPTPLSEATAVLQRDGVVRLEAATCQVDPELCAQLRQGILQAINQKATLQDNDDKTYVPGTRLRFECPMDLTFGGDVRHDLLLPIQNEDDDSNFGALSPVLAYAISHLHPILTTGADLLLPHLNTGNGSSSSSSNRIDDGTIATALEVVEVASLVVRCGSGHQQLHGDYRRFRNNNTNERHGNQEEPKSHTEARIGKMPPRMVTFVALQDVPSISHGATGFITGTHNSQAHGLVYDDNPSGGGYAINLNDQMDDQEIEKVLSRRQQILGLSTSGVRTTEGIRAGEMLIYDASVLHWGSANLVEGNDRAMLYFGVARPGAAEVLGQGQTQGMNGYTALPPVLLDSFTAS